MCRKYSKGYFENKLDAIYFFLFSAFKHLAIVAIVALTTTAALPAPNDKQGRIGIFNVVKFPVSEFMF